MSYMTIMEIITLLLMEKCQRVITNFILTDNAFFLENNNHLRQCFKY